jgi:hypothetical protein
MALSLAPSELLFKDCAMYIASPDCGFYDFGLLFPTQLSDEF